MAKTSHLSSEMSWREADEAADKVEMVVVGNNARTGFEGGGGNPNVIFRNRRPIFRERRLDIAPTFGYGLCRGLERYAVFAKEIVQQ